MKKLFAILLVVFITVNAGCSDFNKETDETEKKIVDSSNLNITSINLPYFFPKLINNEGVNVYHNSENNYIEITFDDNLIDKNYTLGYMQYGTYYGIKNDFDKEKCIFFKYIIKNNELIIIPEEGYMQADIISIYIPQNIMSKCQKTLEDNKLFILSNSAINDDIEYSLVNSEIKREIKSIILIKKKNDGKNIGFINKETDLYNDGESTASAIKLERGESISIIGEKDKFYKVEVYFPTVYKKDVFNNPLSFSENENYNIITGYVFKDDIVRICEPLNNNNYYKVNVYFDDTDTSVHFMTCDPLLGSNEIIIDENVTQINEEDAHFLEASILNDVTNKILWGNSYYTNYVDENGDSYQIDNIICHLPQYEWTEDDYETYNTATELYATFFDDWINKIELPKNYTTDKKIYKKIISNNITLQKIYKDWGYKNKLRDENYFFIEVTKQLFQSNDNNTELLKKDYLSNSDSTFSDRVTNMLHLLQTQHSEYKELDKNYKYIDINIQRKYILNQFTGCITDVDEDNKIFKIHDENTNEDYSILLNDYASTNYTITIGEKISILCYYNFDMKMYYIAK